MSIRVSLLDKLCLSLCSIWTSLAFNCPSLSLAGGIVKELVSLSHDDSQPNLLN